MDKIYCPVKWTISVAVTDSSSPETLSRWLLQYQVAVAFTPCMACLGLCLFPPLLTQGRGAKKVSGILCHSSCGWGDLLPAMTQRLRQEEKNLTMEPGSLLKYLGSENKPLSWERTLGEEHRTYFSDPVNLLLWRPPGTPMLVVPTSWSIWYEAKTLLKSLHPLCFTISLDAAVGQSPILSARGRARHIQPFSPYLQGRSYFFKM